MDGSLKVINLNVKYGEKVVVDKINLSVESGTLCGLLGLNGSGKTTILNAVDGLIGYSGSITCNGKEINKIHEEERAKLISYIPQRTNLKDGVSSLEFVLYGLNPFLKFYQFPSLEQRERAKSVLSDLGLTEKLDCDFGSLSEGQKGLTVLARSIIQNAPIMLMDEPDSSLDYNNKHLLYSTVKKIIKEYDFGGLVSMHDPTFALKYCDKIYILSDGEIVDEINGKGDIVSVRNALRKIYKNIELIEHNGEYLVGINNED